MDDVFSWSVGWRTFKVDRFGFSQGSEVDGIDAVRFGGYNL